MRNARVNSAWKFSAAHNRPSAYEISQDVLDLFQIYVDRLDTQDIIVDIGEDTIDAKEMKSELEELRKALENIGEFEQTLQPGQRPAIDCGKYGCCPDYSKADKKRQIGCASKLCIDVFTDTCNKIFYMPERKKIRRCGNKLIRDNCPYTCNKCKLPASPIDVCQRQSPGGFCCWNGKPAKGPNGLGCPPCKDKYEKPCALYKHMARGCESNAWQIRTFMITYCPKTCGGCPKV